MTKKVKKNRDFLKFFKVPSALTYLSEANNFLHTPASQRSAKGSSSDYWKTSSFGRKEVKREILIFLITPKLIDLGGWNLDTTLFLDHAFGV